MDGLMEKTMILIMTVALMLMKPIILVLPTVPTMLFTERVPQHLPMEE